MQMETADSPDSADSDMVSRAQFVSRNTLGTQKPRSLGTSEALREDTLVARLEQHVKAAKKCRRVSVLSILEESVRIGVRTDSNAFKIHNICRICNDIYIYIEVPELAIGCHRHVRKLKHMLRERLVAALAQSIS